MNDPGFKRFSKVRTRLHTIIFGTDTPAGKLFDLVLLLAIFISIVVVMLESVQAYKKDYGELFITLEWIFTIIFTIEYALRIFISKKPANYIFSYWGIIDLLALVPTYLAIVLTGGSYLMVIRSLRLLRIFRILKVTRYVNEARVLGEALMRSSRKVLIFMGAVFTLVIITGTLMYLIEGESNGFTSIPRSIYWAIVTVTTVGYGDVAPQTTLGQVFSALMMLTGYAIIAVPTGIMTSELSRVGRETKPCIKCNTINEPSSNFCSQCGYGLTSRK